MTESPIGDYLAVLRRRTRADAHTVRRLVDEAADHLQAAAAELEASGMTRLAAETEAVRRFGPVEPIANATARNRYAALAVGIRRAAATLLAWALLVAGISGVLALVMLLSFGYQFVGTVDLFPFSGASITTSAVGTVILRVALGVLGVLLLYRDRLRHRRTPRPKPPTSGLVDAIAALGFTAATAAFTVACLAQALQNSPREIGYPLSAAIATLAATAYFFRRGTRKFVSGHTLFLET